MPRQDPHRWHLWWAWYPVITEEGRIAFCRHVWCRKAFLGCLTAAIGDPELLMWFYTDEPHGHHPHVGLHYTEVKS